MSTERHKSGVDAVQFEEDDELCGSVYNAEVNELSSAWWDTGA